MGGGNKKNKRGSIPSTTFVSSDTTASSASSVTSLVSSPTVELLERTPENDYGVMSDPDENTPTTPVPLLSKEHDPDQDQHPVQESHEAHEPAAGLELKVNHEKDLQAQKPDDDNTDIPFEPLPQSGSRQPSPSSLQPSPRGQSLLSQPQISQTQSSKSLEALKLKLSRDKNFSRKITLHTFFSYIILATEMQRSCSASIASISPDEVQLLIEYMIENHSASDAVKTYLHTLIETNVVRNIIVSIIEFNKEHKDEAFDKLLIEEQIQIELALSHSPDDNKGEKTEKTVDNASSSNTSTSKRCGFFSRLRCFFSGCCG
jgi:hypothetical protein